jgi:tRNA (cytidine/uridine-2'-O-)-methyltransferase
MLEEAICVFAPLGRRNRLKSHALFKASSVAGSVLIRDRLPALELRHPAATGFRDADKRTMRLALFEPDIPQNLGAFIRLSACLGAPLDVIEPCGFPVDDKRIRRAAMDYYDLANMTRHASWTAFQRDRKPGRLVLLTTTGPTRFPDVEFRADDTLLLGRESAGVPAEVHDAADLRLRIPLQKSLRSLNVATAAAMVLGEALRQTNGYAALT